MDCFELKTPKLLEAYCQVGNEVTKNRVFKCFYELYFEDYCKIFRKDCFFGSTLYTVEEQLQTSFDFGLCIFYYKIKLNGWVERGASVRTALFTFCRFQLLALTKILKKFQDKSSSFDPSDLINLITDTLLNRDSGLTDEIDKWISDWNKYLAAFEKLSERCKDFIRWRKLKLISDEEMKAKYPDVDFDSDEPNQITYRCMKKLRE